MAAIWPNRQRRHRALPRYFAASLRHFHVPNGGVRVALNTDGEIAAVAVWDPPGRWDHSTLTTVRALPDLLPALQTRALAAAKVRHTLDLHHPHEPEHWYLANIGTTQNFRGQGYAARLITDELTSNPGIHAYLVCTLESNITYYKQFGFQRAEPFSLPTGRRPSMWPMAINM
ncbi:GNAT family N-acetyltransferase [Nocardia speluncae]|uniref:GNAT family N-acetyltransferase n=2 Tax=Nocardiaceae TaxID=85025 RepID=A0A846XJY3_9NOCA|nr:GNAT family N-acetyltransferase [Nocardia cyriacigeorgica]MBF6478033.1 GNAT family N-acetyltransferase [Nocardia cyriacigeorgica]MBF6553192.1 GNAT family N-acetyltransferase [Nocardia cyriacigeorgica]NKY34893.1 GNAT family N-acetyltransferase [Nocardia speluncae]